MPQLLSQLLEWPQLAAWLQLHFGARSYLQLLAAQAH